MKYSELLYAWLTEKEKEVRHNTITNYSRTITRKLVPEFGNYDLDEFTKDILQEYIYSLSEHMKHESVANVTKVLSQSFLYAVDRNIIKESPYKRIKIPRDKEMKEIKVFTVDEVEKILSLKKYSQQKKDMVDVAVRTGMRIGEILVLSWADINLQDGFLTVRKTLSGRDKNGNPEIAEPKTKYSRRRIDLDKRCIEIFRRIRAENNAEYVFCKKDGSIIGRESITQSFKRMCKAASIPYRSFHALRHTHASILLSKGIHPKIVQERLGHSKISTTLDTYSHLIPGIQKVAVEVFDEIM